jgi:dUTP pyrophosphatase
MIEIMENKITVRIKKVKTGGSSGARTPFYASPGAAGADLYACLENDLLVKPGQRVGVPTGIAIELPGPEVAALVFARSGLASKKGLALSNGVGVIDSDYRGEIVVLMVNLGQEEVTVRNGDRIAQMLLIPVCQASFIEAEELGITERGEGGFGSTGI